MTSFGISILTPNHSSRESGNGFEEKMFMGKLCFTLPIGKNFFCASKRCMKISSLEWAKKYSLEVGSILPPSCIMLPPPKVGLQKTTIYVKLPLTVKVVKRTFVYITPCIKSSSNSFIPSIDCLYSEVSGKSKVTIFVYTATSNFLNFSNSYFVSLSSNEREIS